MKKKILIILPIIIFLLASCLIIYLFKDKPINASKFELPEYYYTNSEYKEINSDGLNELLEKKESFVVFVYQPMCIASSNFNAVLDSFLKEKSLTIYKISFEDLQKTKYKRVLKHYPSFMIFYKGKLSSYLDAESDEDVNYFKKTDEFTKWLEKRIELKDNNNINNEEKSKESQIEEIKKTKVNLPNVIKETGKVNIYLFYGETCPHCKAEKEFLSSLESSYGHLFNLHTYEVWHNSENRERLNVFGAYNNTLVDGVPYTIIGEKSFSGFGESTKKEIIKAIEEESKKDYDLYIDVISKN